MGVAATAATAIATAPTPMLNERRRVNAANESTAVTTETAMICAPSTSCAARPAVRSTPTIAIEASHSTQAMSGARHTRNLTPPIVSDVADLPAAQGWLERPLPVAGVGGVEVDAGADDRVDAVERRGVEGDFGGGELALELLHRARADDGGGHARVVGDERDGELDQRDAGVVGDAGELLDRFELALVLGQRHVEARHEALTGGRGGGAVGAPVAREPAATQRAVGEDAHAVALRGRQHVELDAAHEQRVRRLLRAEALQAPLA